MDFVAWRIPLAEKAHVGPVKVPPRDQEGVAKAQDTMPKFDAFPQRQKVAHGCKLLFVDNSPVGKRCKTFRACKGHVKQSSKHMAEVKVDQNKHLLSAVVPFCSLESDLIDRVVRSLAPVCGRIVVVYLTHFFTGEPDPEAHEIVTRLASEVPEVVPVRVQWNATQGKTHQAFWPCELRLRGFVNTVTPWILMVDADEVLRNAERFAEWFATRKDTPSTPKLANYWYFLSERRRAKPLEDSIVLTHRSLMMFPMFRAFTLERTAFCVKDERMVKDLQGEPMFDHFSWVRSPEKLRRKVATWGHREDRNWSEALEVALSQDPLTTPDFLHGYEFEIV